MRLLVTGGAGFIGSNFIHYWMAKYPQDKIVNLDDLTYAGNLENLVVIENNPNYTFVKGEISNKELVEEIMVGIDIVVHFAAETHVDRSIMDSGAFVKTNVLGTQVLLEVARKKNTRLHHVSTDEVFGSLKLKSNEAFDENNSYNPRNPYAASKAGSDHLVRSYFYTYGLPITISNTSNNFGPFQFPEKFIPLTITNLLENKPVPIYGKGNQVRDWIYVADHCAGIDLIIQKGKAGETYCLGGLTEDISNLQVAQMIAKLLKKPAELLQFVADRPGHDVRYAINWSKANLELGYKPMHSFDDYLSQTIQWYQKNSNWWKRVKSGEYQKYYKSQYGYISQKKHEI